jgi:hypothetical protein
MEATLSSETSVDFHVVARRDIAEDRDVPNQLYGNFKSNILDFVYDRLLEYKIFHACCCTQCGYITLLITASYREQCCLHNRVKIVTECSTSLYYMATNKKTQAFLTPSCGVPFDNQRTSRRRNESSCLKDFLRLFVN